MFHLFIFQSYNWNSVARYTFIGSFVLSPVLYVWYKWLDTRFPAKTGKVIFKKVILDSAALGMPLYSAFYLGKQSYFLDRAQLQVQSETHK